MDLITLLVRAENRMIPYVLRAAEDLALDHGMSEDDMLRMRLNLEEIMIGIIEYGYSNNPDASIKITLSIDDMDFVVSVRDNGRPYDYTTLEGDGYAEIACILSNMGNAPDLVNHGREGREQTFRFPTGRRLMTIRSEKPEGEVDVTTFDMHLMRPEECMQVSQCLYDEFGYTYVNDIVYYPERLADATQRGYMTCFTATSPKGEVAAHVALIGNSRTPGTVELAMGVVKKKFRKASLMSRLSDVAMSHARSSDLMSINAQPVGYHPYTQKICSATSFGVCAVCFNYVNGDVSTSHGSGHRRPLFWSVLMLRDEHRVIHSPAEIRHIVDKVISNCKLGRSFAEGSEPVSDKGFVSSDMNHVLRMGKIYVDSIGKDTRDAIRLEDYRMKAALMEVSDIFINLQDPAAPWLYEYAKTLGYFCTGMLPASEKCDYIVMQKMLVGIIDYEAFVTIPEYQEFLDMVRKMDPEGDL